MTGFGFFLTGCFWVLAGVYTAYKRDWYIQHKQVEDDVPAIMFSIVFGPVSLVFAIFKIIFLRKWDNS